ncbi:MAG: hypothetical protein RR052_01965 [Oscillospiraceae bacterium]
MRKTKVGTIILLLGEILLFSACIQTKNTIDYSVPSVKKIEELSDMETSLLQSGEKCQGHYSIIDADTDKILYTFAQAVEENEKTQKASKTATEMCITDVAFFDYEIQNTYPVINKEKTITQVNGFKFVPNEKVLAGYFVEDKICLASVVSSFVKNGEFYRMKTEYKLHTKNGENIETKTLNAKENLEDADHNESFTRLLKYKDEIYYVCYEGENTYVKNAFTDETMLAFENRSLVDGQIRVDGDVISAHITENNRQFVVCFNDFKQVSKITLDDQKEPMLGFCVLNDNLLLSFDAPLDDQSKKNNDFKLNITNLKKSKVSDKVVNFSKDNYFETRKITSNGQNLFLYNDRQKLKLFKINDKNCTNEIIKFLPNGAFIDKVINISKNEFIVYVTVPACEENNYIFKITL